MDYSLFHGCKISNYKCFGAEPTGFEKIRPINLLIGRNNSGKSSLLDLIQYLTDPKSIDIYQFGHKGQTPEIHLSEGLTESDISPHFRHGVSGGGIPGDDHWNYGKNFIGVPISWKIKRNPPNELIAFNQDCPNPVLDRIRNTIKEKKSEFSGCNFRRLSSDRNVKPESDDVKNYISPNGDGASIVIRNFLLKNNLPSELVENDILNDLNFIFKPDSVFKDIVVQQIEDDRWEIFLGEERKGRIPISQSGSGLKTVLLVLSFIHLLPYIDTSDISSYIFGFEELENNLHPSLQRKLFLYLKEIAITKKCTFFISTHSNVVIDLFSKDTDAQIVHVKHDGTQASVATCETYIHHKNILDDLDIRASDLLQSNCILWVEGPSDRLYFNRWIELWTEGKIKEGAHYQCVFYGGRLLAHLSADDPDFNFEDVVKILRVNKNAIILMDSDRRKKHQRISDRKRKICDEIDNNDGFCWITAGKEIENYIPKEAIEKYFSTQNIEQIDRYEIVAHYLEKIKSNAGEKYLNNKVLFASQIIQFMSQENLKSILDLDDSLSKVIQKIQTWNK